MPRTAILSMRTETDGRPLAVLLLFWGLVGFVAALRSLWRWWRGAGVRNF